MGCPNIRRSTRARLLAGVALALGLAAPGHAQRALQAVPTTAQGTIAYAFGIANAQGGLTDRVQIASTAAIIDWTPTDVAGTGPVAILPLNNRLEFINIPGANTTFTALNRIVPADPTRPILFEGTVQSRIQLTGFPAVPGGAVWFYSPGGIILNGASRFDVGSLVLTTSPIDTTGGLFGPGNTIRFGQAPNAGASISIAPGALITANSTFATTTGNYVALVAPQITQGGVANVSGSVAYVGAESANVAINAGLFDISFTTGSGVATPIVHTGTTTGPAANAGNRRIAIASVAKNDAITILLGGQIGFSTLGATTDANGAIVISAGYNVSGQTVVGNPIGAAASASIGTASFTSALGASASGDLVVSPNAAGETTGFRLASFDALGAVTIGLDAGERLTFGDFAGGDGDLTLRAPGGTARLQLAAGADIQGGDLLLDTSAETQGGVAELLIDGATATFGTVRLLATGTGIEAGALGGTGTGGTALLSVTGPGQPTFAATTLDLDARGFGGTSATGVGGAGTGGNARASFTGGATSIGGGTGAVTLRAGATGGFGGTAGGAARGGEAQLAAESAQLTFGSLDITADAEGLGEQLIGQFFAFSAGGGSATGGTATLALSNGTLAVDTLLVSAQATGGAGGRDPAGKPIAGATAGAAFGGAARLDVTGGALTATAITARAGASGGDGSPASTGGAASGGIVSVIATQGSVAAPAWLVAARGDGGSGDTGGAGSGGGISFAADAGTIDFPGTSLVLDAEGQGGTGGARGGAALGGTIAVRARDGGRLAGSSASLDLLAAGRGGDAGAGGTGGNARGGGITLLAADGAIDLDGDLTVDAAGTTGHSANGTPPEARGGTIDVTLTAGAGDGSASLLRSGSGILLLDASGRVRDPGDGAAVAGSGGSGIGGSATLIVESGLLEAADLRVLANGRGGNSPAGGVGGDGQRGRAAVAMSGGRAVAGTLLVSAEAAGGLGADEESGYGVFQAAGSGGGGIATSPVAEAGASLRIDSGEFAFGLARVQAEGVGGRGGRAVASGGNPPPGLGNAGAGGLGAGGDVVVAVAGAAATTGGLLISADGRGGAGGTVEIASSPAVQTRSGGAGGTGIGGTADAAVAGAANLTLLTATADGAGGNGGSVSGLFGPPFAPGSTSSGGAAGDGRGGSARVRLATPVSLLVPQSRAEGRGGSGGTAAVGGNGGTGLGGRAETIVDASGISTTFGLAEAGAFARGLGGDAGQGAIGSGGDGGAATGGEARLLVTDGAIVAAPIFVNAAALGGSGGAGGSDAAGGAGGRGGAAAGGRATIEARRAELTLLAGEGVTIGAAALGGDGGDGGVASDPLAEGGAGGAGGDAIAGTARLQVTGGTLISASTAPAADGLGGRAGFAAPRGQGAPVGIGNGGSVEIEIVDDGSAIGRAELGLTRLAALGGNVLDPTLGRGGSITVVLGDSGAAGGLAASRLEMVTRRDDGPGGAIGLTGSGRATIRGDVSMRAGDAITFDLAGGGGLDAAGAVTAETGAGAITIAHAGRTAPSIAATGALDLLAAGDVAAASGQLTAAAIRVRAAGGSAALGTMSAADGIDVAADGGVTLGSAAAGTALLVRAGNAAGGPLQTGADAGLAGTVTAASIDVGAGGGITLGAGAALAATGDIRLAAAADLAAPGAASVTGSGAILLLAGRNIVAPGLAVTSPGPVDLAGGSVTLGTLRAAGLRTRDAAGTLTVADGLTVAGAIAIVDGIETIGGLRLRAGTGIDVGAAQSAGADLNFETATGGVRLGRTGFGSAGTPRRARLAGQTITLGTLDLADTLTANASGGIAVDGVVAAGSIALTSADLAIGTGGRLTASAAGGIALANLGGRMAIGGGDRAGVYSLSAAELTRIATAGDLTLVATPAAGQVGAAFALPDPAGATLLLDTLAFGGSQLGPQGTVTFDSRGSLGIVGTVAFDGFGAGQTVRMTSPSALGIATETGSVAVRGGGGLAGTLRLEGQSVYALSAVARADAATLGLAALSDRLGRNDGPVAAGGAIQAGAVVARVGSALLVQNSGATADPPGARRGVTAGAGGFRIEARGTAPIAIAVNGRIDSATGPLTGADVVTATRLDGAADPASTINGCLIANPAACVVAPPPPPPPPPPSGDPALGIARDLIRERVARAAEGALGGQGLLPPQPVIQLLELEPNPYAPLIDEPVTGTGNDDLWDGGPLPARGPGG